MVCNLFVALVMVCFRHKRDACARGRAVKEGEELGKEIWLPIFVFNLEIVDTCTF